jgi:hypothetical protein
MLFIAVVALRDDTSRSGSHAQPVAACILEFISRVCYYWKLLFDPLEFCNSICSLGFGSRDLPGYLLSWLPKPGIHLAFRPKHESNRITMSSQLQLSTTTLTQTHRIPNDLRRLIYSFPGLGVRCEVRSQRIPSLYAQT